MKKLLTTYIPALILMLIFLFVKLDFTDKLNKASADSLKADSARVKK